MNAYWIVNIAVWFAVLVWSATGAATAAFRRNHVRRGDPMRLATFLVASLFIGFPLRWLVWPDMVQAWKALYVISALTGLFVLRLMRAYGRGERV